MLSVLIVNWNTRELLRACLASLRAHPCQIMPQEVIVVDNASHDGSAEMVRTEFPEVILVEPGKNTGYAGGNNLAFGKASGEFLLTLNPDTEVYESTLDKAIEALRRHSDWGALGAKQIGPDGEVQRSIRGFPTRLTVIGEILGGAPEYRLPNFDYEVEQPAPQPMGTFLLFRREALEAIGSASAPYDEQFPIFFNEVDLLKRMHDKGWIAGYSPSVQLLHHGGEGTKQVRKNMIWESHRSLIRYLRKHYPSFWNIPLGILIWLGALWRAKGVHAGFRA